MRFIVGEQFKDNESTWVYDDRARFVHVKKGDVVEHADLEDGSEAARIIKGHLAAGRVRQLPDNEAAT